MFVFYLSQFHVLFFLSDSLQFKKEERREERVAGTD